jgi:hypothetical protein
MVRSMCFALTAVAALAWTVSVETPRRAMQLPLTQHKKPLQKACAMLIIGKRPFMPKRPLSIQRRCLQKQLDL